MHARARTHTHTQIYMYSIIYNHSLKAIKEHKFRYQVSQCHTHPEDEVEDVKHIFQEEDATAAIVFALDFDSPRVPVSGCGRHGDGSGLQLALR